jgi:hypothetical protein
MRYFILLFILLGGCVRKIIQKPQENTELSSPDNENNVLYISNELQKLDVYGPLLWFLIIIGSVMLLALSSILFKK